MRRVYCKLAMLYALVIPAQLLMFGQDVSVEIRTVSPSAGSPDVTVLLQGRKGFRELIRPERLPGDRTKISSRDQFIRHLMWTWQSGTLDQFLDNWAESDRQEQEAIFTPENFRRNKEIANKISAWTKVAEFSIGDVLVVAIERVSEGKPPEVSFVSLARCGSRLCQTNRLSKDPLLSVVFARLRKELAMQKAPAR